eukprot:TRINITY_DN3052_c0_g1_i2.p2 TRINITY_DN3052_c0_g1~~TRINITY_DN3052_c0_g1_i2.p2  ORF type:complete len:173 (+),score=52.78 TRINITY_DN3052_c0_g1_i2:813-1331(+)
MSNYQSAKEGKSKASSTVPPQKPTTRQSDSLISFDEEPLEVRKPPAQNQQQDLFANFGHPQQTGLETAFNQVSLNQQYNPPYGQQPNMFNQPQPVQQVNPFMFPPQQQQYQQNPPPFNPFASGQPQQQQPQMNQGVWNPFQSPQPQFNQPAPQTSNSIQQKHQQVDNNFFGL